MEKPQIISTKQFGDLEVVMSFHEPPFHIALCSNGAYIHISGLPVKDKSELRKAIPAEFLQDALDWWDHRHEMEENPPLRVLVQPDGSCIFEDGSPITNTSQLTQALKPGPMLDAALLWFTKKKVAEEEGKKPVQTKKPSTPKQVVKKTGSKKAARKPPARPSASPAAEATASMA